MSIKQSIKDKANKINTRFNASLTPELKNRALLSAQKLKKDDSTNVDLSPGKWKKTFSKNVDSFSLINNLFSKSYSIKDNSLMFNFGLKNQNSIFEENQKKNIFVKSQNGKFFSHQRKKTQEYFTKKADFETKQCIESSIKCDIKMTLSKKTTMTSNKKKSYQEDNIVDADMIDSMSQMIMRNSAEKINIKDDLAFQYQPQINIMVPEIKQKNEMGGNNIFGESFSSQRDQEEEIKQFNIITREKIKKIRKLRVPSEKEISDLQINNFGFEDEINLKGKKLAVLDLNQTLVHILSETCELSDFKIKILRGDNKIQEYGIRVRPYLMEFIEEIRQNYIIVIYTSSLQIFADAILDILDPDKKYFSYRLYRKHCYKTTLEDEQVYIKDLRIFKRINQSQIIIVDNSVLSFAYHINNGIPILPFIGNKNDNELQILTTYLKYLFKFDNLLEANKKILRLEILMTTISDVSECSPSLDNEDDKSFDKNQINDSMRRAIISNNCDSASSNDSRNLRKCLMILSSSEQNAKAGQDGVFNTITSQSNESISQCEDWSIRDKKI